MAFIYFVLVLILNPNTWELEMEEMHYSCVIWREAGKISAWGKIIQSWALCESQDGQGGWMPLDAF